MRGDRARSARELRRWVRLRRSAARATISASSLYVAVFTVVMVLAMTGPRLRAVLWPHWTPPDDARRVTALSLALLCLLALFALLRRLGPLVLGRADVSWLLPAPVSRRGLLLPSFCWVAVLSGTAGLLVALGMVGQLAPRPLGMGSLGAGLAAGPSLGLLVLLAAVECQLRDRLARVLDLLVLPVAAGCAVVVAAASAVSGWAPVRAVLAAGPWGWPALPVPRSVPLAGALGLAALLLGARTVYALRSMPDRRIVEASQLAGSYLDATYAAEPSFVADLAERGYWTRRRLRSRPVRRTGRLPLLAALDLRVVLRRPARLCWLAVAMVLPVVALRGRPWMPPVAVLLGGMVAAGAATGALRTETLNPVLPRAMAMSERRALAGHAVVPIALGAIWCGGALLLAQALGELPAGPWWALGLAAGVAAGVAALRHARTGMIQHDLPAFDTPMGGISTGPMAWLATGMYGLVLGLPAAVRLAPHDRLSWSDVFLQLLVAAGGLGWDLYRARRRATG